MRNAMSLFANIGISEAYLDSEIHVCLANEIDPKRADFYQHLYPNTEMICDDITKEETQKQLIEKGKEKNVSLIIATPPCQGMSMAGKKKPFDERNSLICNAITVILGIMPDYILLENVPQQLSTKILYHGEEILIPDYLNKVLGDKYHLSCQVCNTADYGVPQSRKRAIFLISRKGLPVWDFPEKEEKKVTMRDVIGDLPSVDPFIRDVSREKLLEIFPNFEEKKEAALAVSPWHRPPSHLYRHVVWMQHTPSGESARDNEDAYKPRKENGELIKGYHSTYKRQNWDLPAWTVTMNNGSIGSQNNGHPGHPLENGLYSDPRVLTIFELMRVSSLPDDWNIPLDTSENFIRRVIGEGVPPLFMLKCIQTLPETL